MTTPLELRTLADHVNKGMAGEDDVICALRDYADALERAQAGITDEVTRTAPERIWLQVSDDAADRDAPFPVPDGDLTWCVDSVVDCEVSYIRADLLSKESQT